MAYELVLAALFSLVTSTIYAIVGAQLFGRPVSEQARLAATLFAIWWFGLAVSGYITAILNLFAAAGYTDVNLWLTFGQFNLLVVLVALWALLYYLLYLYTGSKRVLWPLSILYIGLYVWLVYLVNSRTPVGVEVQRWRAQLDYGEQQFDPLLGFILIGLLLFPQIGAAIAYITLAFKAEDRTQKFRILVVGIAIIVWFGTASVASFAGFGMSDAWQVLSRLIALAATLSILMAYRPPAWMRRKYHLRSISEPKPMELSNVEPHAR